MLSIDGRMKAQSAEVERHLRAALDWIAYAGRELERGDTKQADRGMERAASAIQGVLDTLTEKSS